MVGLPAAIAGAGAVSLPCSPARHRSSCIGKASVAIDDSKFKAVNNRDRNFTRGKIDRRRAQLEESVASYLSQLDTADRQEPSDVLVLKTARLKEKLDKRKEEMGKLAGLREANVGLARRPNLAH